MCVCVFVNVHVCTRVHSPLLTGLFCCSASLGCPTDLKLTIISFSLAPERGVDEMTLNTLQFLLIVEGQSQGTGKKGLPWASNQVSKEPGVE